MVYYVIHISSNNESNLPMRDNYLVKKTSDYNNRTIWGSIFNAIKFKNKEEAIIITRECVKDLYEKGSYSFGVYVDMIIESDDDNEFLPF